MVLLFSFNLFCFFFKRYSKNLPRSYEVLPLKKFLGKVHLGPPKLHTCTTVTACNIFINSFIYQNSATVYTIFVRSNSQRNICQKYTSVYVCIYHCDNLSWLKEKLHSFALIVDLTQDCIAAWNFVSHHFNMYCQREHLFNNRSVSKLQTPFTT